MCDCLSACVRRLLPEKPNQGDDEPNHGNNKVDAGGKRPSVSPPAPPPPDRPSENAIYTGIWPFDARHRDELSFQVGDLLEVMCRNGDWWTARKIEKNGRILGTGIVPHNYLARAESLQMHLNDIVSLGSPCHKKKPNIEDINHLLDDWVLPKSEFTIENQLGNGCFSQVFRGRWKNHINVAIKVLKNDSVDNTEFHREVEILKRLHHRHLISLFAICTESSPYYIITELMEKGSLLQFLRGKEGQNQDAASLIDMATQVADGMSYLEEQKSIHRDLAARNVLVGEDYICKVADFGLARLVKEPFYISEEKKIPYKWSAPEAISHGKFSIKSDVWSFGVLLYEIMTYGSVPYPGFNNREVYNKVKSGYRMEAPSKCPGFIHGIMLKCWQEQPENRPAFKHLRDIYIKI
uniref:Protein-tyrosine kinase 6 n=1 Tax=Poecilia reticulata TaxID=8081 RepID=A0A3P9Q6N6_POERE